MLYIVYGTPRYFLRQIFVMVRLLVLFCLLSVRFIYFFCMFICFIFICFFMCRETGKGNRCKVLLIIHNGNKNCFIHQCRHLDFKLQHNEWELFCWIVYEWSEKGGKNESIIRLTQSHTHTQAEMVTFTQCVVLVIYFCIQMEKFPEFSPRFDQVPVPTHPVTVLPRRADVT